MLESAGLRPESATGSTRLQHVLIVGGGLAGPCLALCLAKSGIRSTIFELRPTLGTTGGSMTLASNALRALDYAGVYKEVMLNGYVHTKMKAITSEGWILGDIAVGNDGDGENDYPAIRIMRSKIHEILIKACEEHQLIEVKWDKKFKEIDEDEVGVKIGFEDGETYEGDVLIGSDGIHSKVRDYILSSQGYTPPTPTYAGTATIVTFFDKSNLLNNSSDNHQPLPLPHMYFCPNGMIMLTSSNPDCSNLQYGITTPWAEQTREGWKHLEQSGEALIQARKDYKDVQAEPLKRVLDNDEYQSTSIWSPHEIPQLETWHTKRVCVIGDAAHALPPNGQGAAMAFEDAGMMSRVLSESHTGTSVQGLNKRLAKFEEVRRKRVDMFREEKRPWIMNFMRNNFTSSTWIWFFKKWAFWLFFTVKGGTVSMKGVHEYDLTKEDISIQ